MAYNAGKCEIMKAYKVFNPDWTCRGFQFEVGKTFEEDVKPELCNRGFHACKNIVDCFNYYSFNPDNKVAEVELIGDVVGQEGEKQATNKIRIVKELSWQEVLVLANTGKACTGLANSGNRNSGNRNSGNRNSGDHNSGNRNSGDYNSGDYNSGNYNSGDYNSGNRNSGDYNSGNRNSGDHNSGDYNSGNRNSGNYNSGDYNSGNRNSGDYNSGNRNSGNNNSGNRNSGDYNSGNYNSGDYNSGNYNSGNRNSGNRNSGNRNSGDYNSGDYNSGNYNSGHFNSITPTEILVFNKPCDRVLWNNSEKPYFFNKVIVNQWIWFDDMTDEEKIQHPKAFVCGGYLKQYSYKEAWQNAYKQASERDIAVLKTLPNFDAAVFEEITGIKVL